MSATTDPPTKFALYYKAANRRGKWQLHEVFDTEQAAWDRVRACPLKHLAYWVAAVPVSETSTELTPPALKNRKPR